MELKNKHTAELTSAQENSLKTLRSRWDWVSKPEQEIGRPNKDGTALFIVVVECFGLEEGRYATRMTIGISPCGHRSS